MIDFFNFVVMPSLAAGAIYTLVATGFNVLERTTGVLNFAHGALITWAPLAVIYGVVRLDLPVPLAFVVGALVVIGLALVEERLAIRPFMQSGKALPWILSTFGVAIILMELSVLPFQGVAQGFRWNLGHDSIQVGAARLSPIGLTAIVAAFVTVVALGLLYRRTWLGRQLEAVAEDIDGAQAIGIFTTRMSRMAALLAAAVAIITGWVAAPVFQVFPELGMMLTFNGFVAAAIGGIGSIRGGLVGGMIVGALVQLSTIYLGSHWINPVLFATLLLIYLVRPTGIFGHRSIRLV